MFKSIKEIEKKVRNYIKNENTNKALKTIHDFVEKTITNPIFTAKILSSQRLDRLCLLIGSHNLKNIPVNPKKKESIDTIYLVSRLQKSGGHSQLIKNFIKSQPNKSHLIISTEVSGRSDKTFFYKLFSKNKHVSFLYAPNSNFAIRLSWVQLNLIIYQPKHVYLFNHHQDSIAVSALVPELNLVGSFCHHGDHHLCLGVHFDHIQHIDFHPMGFHYCRDKLGIKNNHYIPLTLQDKHALYLESNFTRGGKLTTATAARSNKVEIPYYVSYIDAIPKLLKTTKGRHIHIGKLTPWALHRIYYQMRKQGIPKDNFFYIEWTPSVWNTLQDQKVDIYIASFPYGAGLTLIEAMGAGIPVILHQHMYSRILSGIELAYPEAFKWNEIEDLLTHLSKLTPDRLAYEKSLSRSRYERFHNPRILEKTLVKNRTNSSQLSPPLLSSDFKLREDEWANWVEYQLRIRQQLYKFIYRLGRRIRRWKN